MGSWFQILAKRKPELIKLKKIQTEETVPAALFNTVFGNKKLVTKAAKGSNTAVKASWISVE